MKDRVKLNNGKSSKLMCPSDYAPSTFADFLSDLADGDFYVDITANNDLNTNPGVTEVGTALNKANLLSDSTATLLGYGATDDPSPNDAIALLKTLLDKFLQSRVITLNANSWAKSVSSIDTPYSQTISVTGITADSQNVIGVSLANPDEGESYSMRQNRVAGYNDFIYDGWYECGLGYITFKTYNLPTYTFKLLIVGG